MNHGLEFPLVEGDVRGERSKRKCKCNVCLFHGVPSSERRVSDQNLGLLHPLLTETVEGSLRLQRMKIRRNW